MGTETEICPRCGEAVGSGLACVLCAQVRLARNQPVPEPAFRWRKTTAAAPAARTEEDEPMAVRLPHGPMPPLQRADAGEERKAWPKGFPCRNPDGNPKCAGTCGVEGGLCRSCGIRHGKARGQPAAALKAPPRPGEETPADAQAKAPEPGTYARLPSPASRAGPRPLPAPAAAEGPGPLTLAVCDFFGAACRASEKVEARMTLERRKLSISVEMTLPEEA